MAREQRKSTRIRVQVPGRIFGIAGEPLARCIMVDVSSGGAQLVLIADPEVPQRFALCLSKNGRVRRSCELVWRVGNRVGLRFLDQAPRPDGSRLARGA